MRFTHARVVGSGLFNSHLRCGKPKIPIQGDGRWVKQYKKNHQSNWVISCYNSNDIPAITKLHCHPKKGWIQRVPAACLNPEQIKAFLSKMTSKQDGKENSKNNCGTPKIEIEGDGRWVQQYHSQKQIKYVLYCNDPHGIPATTELHCHSKKGWIQKGPAACFNPPKIPAFLDVDEITNTKTKFKCWTADGHTLMTDLNNRALRKNRYYDWNKDGEYTWTLHM